MLFPVATTMTNASGTTGLVTVQIKTTNMSILKVITYCCKPENSNIIIFNAGSFKSVIPHLNNGNVIEVIFEEVLLIFPLLVVF